MAIKASDLKKMLPEGGKKNCKECGLPSCFAFAMKLTKGGIELDRCPYIATEMKREIETALVPPMTMVTIGKGEEAIEIGEEEVMYRHEKTFLREPGIAILVSDEESDEVIDQKLKEVKNSVFERAQIILRPNLWALKFDSMDRSRFEAVVKKVYDSSPLTAIIISHNLDALFWARDVYIERNPLIYPITKENMEEAIPRIKASPTPVGVKAEGIEALIPLTEKLKEQGINDLILDTSPRSLLQGIQNQTIIRRSALKQGVRALGYPTIAFPYELTHDSIEEILYAGAFVAKYAGIVVTTNTAKDYLHPLLIQRMDIYSDPRKLRTVESKVYEINEPGEDAPILVSTNFALTFFSVSSEAESSRVPNYLAILDTGGLGIQPAMGAGKFNSILIAQFIKETGLEERVKAKRLILPWFAFQLKNDLLDELPGWEVYVGPKSVNQLSTFLVEMAREWGVGHYV